MGLSGRLARLEHMKSWVPSPIQHKQELHMAVHTCDHSSTEGKAEDQEFKVILDSRTSSKPDRDR